MRTIFGAEVSPGVLLQGEKDKPRQRSPGADRRRPFGQTTPPRVYLLLLGIRRWVHDLLEDRLCVFAYLGVVDVHDTPLDRKLAELTHGVRADGSAGLSRRAGYPRSAVLVHRSVTHVRHHRGAEQESRRVSMQPSPANSMTCGPPFSAYNPDRRNKFHALVRNDVAPRPQHRRGDQATNVVGLR